MYIFLDISKKEEKIPTKLNLKVKKSQIIAKI